MDAGEKYTAMRELAALREERARLTKEVEWWRDASDTGRIIRERDEARAELVRTEKLRQQNAEYLERAEAEVARLEGLILDCATTSRYSPDALLNEARRIRAAKGEK